MCIYIYILFIYNVLYLTDEIGTPDPDWSPR